MDMAQKLGTEVQRLSEKKRNWSINLRNQGYGLTVACCFHSSLKWVCCIRKTGAVVESCTWLMALLPSVTNIWFACCMSALWHIFKLVDGALAGWSSCWLVSKKYKIGGRSDECKGEHDWIAERKVNHEDRGFAHMSLQGKLKDLLDS